MSLRSSIASVLVLHYEVAPWDQFMILMLDAYETSLAAKPIGIGSLRYSYISGQEMHYKIEMSSAE